MITCILLRCHSLTLIMPCAAMAERFSCLFVVRYTKLCGCAHMFLWKPYVKGPVSLLGYVSTEFIIERTSSLLYTFRPELLLHWIFILAVPCFSSSLVYVSEFEVRRVSASSTTHTPYWMWQCGVGGGGRENVDDFSRCFYVFARAIFVR